jgi:hypothetical protein
MGILDFWKARRGSANDRVIAKRMYLASLGGGQGMSALFISGFDPDERVAPEKLIHARMVVTDPANGFVRVSRQQARDWVLMKSALRLAESVTPLASGGTIVLSTDITVADLSDEERAELAARPITERVQVHADKIIEKVHGAIMSLVQRLTRDSKVDEAVMTIEKTRLRERFTRENVPPEQIEQRVNEEITRIVPDNTPDDKRKAWAIQGYSIGNLFTGRYRSQAGNVYDEKSFAVEIAGIDSATLKEVAHALRQAFFQREVLVKDANDNKVYLLGA